MWFYILLSICVCLLTLVINNRNTYWKRKGIIQVEEAIWKFIFDKKTIPVFYKEIYDKYRNELHVGLFLGAKPALVLRSLDNIQSVLTGDFGSFYSRGIVVNPKDTLADNILFIDEYERWKIIRQKISPVFTAAKLKNMFYIMDRCARDFVTTVENNPESFNQPFKALYRYTTAALGSALFGIDTHVQNTMDSPFIDMSWDITNPSFKTKIKFAFINFFPKVSNILNIKAFGKYEEFLVGVVKNVLESRKKSQEIRHDFIDLCVELQKQGTMKDPQTGFELEPSDEVIAAQAFFFFLAGADTSANTMHFTLIELANNPDILNRLHKEIDEVFDNCGEKLTYNDLEKLNYLDMVVNEAIRKYPPIGSYQRTCTKTTKLPVGNLKINKGEVVIIPVFGLHRDEKYFPNPELYDPERFSPNNISSVPKAYMPFGEGNRICIGMRFARLQVKVGLAWMLRRYTLLPQDIKIDTFEASTFALRVPDIHYEVVPRKQ